ncbi:hypothetical protein RUND412_010147 [Rhizina undulata]
MRMTSATIPVAVAFREVICRRIQEMNTTSTQKEQQQQGGCIVDQEIFLGYKGALPAPLAAERQMRIGLTKIDDEDLLLSVKRDNPESN